MKRKQFLRDIALGIAASLLPRILQPAVPEVVSEGAVATAGFEGIIPYILRQKNVVYLDVDRNKRFTITEMNELCQNWYSSDRHMRTKEEIISQYEPYPDKAHVRVIGIMMDEYARQQGVAFIKWAIDSRKVIGDNYGDAYTPHEEEDLYDQFIEHQQSTDNKKQ